jgi:3-dehydroquinate synthase
METNIIYQGQEHLISEVLDHKNIAVIADANTNGFCLFEACKLIPEISNARLIIIPAGEQNKTLDVVQYIWMQMQKLGVNKSWIVINIGGGVVCDMAGFACATYMRGIDFINIPTTLLAMNDASFGGKNGFNFGGIKNNIGTFCHPILVYISPHFLRTISDKQMANGAVESIKHALIYDADLWANFKQYTMISKFADIETIKQSVAIKQHFVTLDMYDNHQRQALNFGHSVGHAIEALQLESSNPLLHGEAVFLGMLVELKLSELILNIDKNIRIDLMKIKQLFYEKITVSVDKINIIDKIMHDKKNTETINMSLLKNIAEPAIQIPVSVSQIEEALLILY